MAVSLACTCRFQFEGSEKESDGAFPVKTIKTPERRQWRHPSFPYC